MSLPPTALTGFTNATLYDAHRPTYHPLAVKTLLTSLPPHTTNIIELGSGTGKFTALLPTTSQILAIEPHASMRSILSQKSLPNVTVKEGTAYNIPSQDDWADAVIVAQAFHWFATAEALSEMLRVLRPGGSVGLIWNVEDYNQARSFQCRSSWEEKLRDLNWRFTKDSSPRYKDEKWRGVFDSDVARGFELPIQEYLHSEEFKLSREELWRRLNTLSNIANLDENDKVVLRTEFDKIVDEAGETQDGRVTIHSTCHVAWTYKR